MTSFSLLSFSALHPGGIYAPSGKRPWNESQCGPDDVARAQVYAKPFPSFGKLALPDKLAFSAAALLLGERPLDGESTGIVVGIPRGSLSSDCRYMESVVGGFPSPALFSATLPSSPVAELAISFGLKGPNRVVVHEDSSGLIAVELASRILFGGKADAVVVVTVYALEHPERRTTWTGAGAAPNAAFGLLLGRSNGGASPARLDLDISPKRGSGRSTADDVYFSSLVEHLAAGEGCSLDIETSVRCGCVRVTMEGLWKS